MRYKDKGHFAEELAKAISNDIEELKKSIKPDAYDAKVHKYPDSQPEMTDRQESHHIKLFSNANPHLESGDEAHDNYKISANHYMKTGKAIKFGRPQSDWTTKGRQHGGPPLAGPKGDIP